MRWRLTSGRWQRPLRGVLVTHSGPLTPDQDRWAHLLAAGPHAVLAGLTSASLDGLMGFDEQVVSILVPHGAARPRVEGAVVRQTTMLGSRDVNPLRMPRRTRPARSLVDAATWASRDGYARAIVHAGVQQRLVLASDLALVLRRRHNTARRALLWATLLDAAGGSHTVTESDVLRICRRHGLPSPSRQVRRRDGAGSNRYLDSYFAAWCLVVEIDGAAHHDVLAWWADMDRDNDLVQEGNRVLRFLAFVVREQPERVAARLREVLITAGWSPAPDARLLMSS